jgi:hypothetical protein
MILRKGTLSTALAVITGLMAVGGGGATLLSTALLLGSAYGTLFLYGFLPGSPPDRARSIIHYDWKFHVALGGVALFLAYFVLQKALPIDPAPLHIALVVVCAINAFVFYVFFDSLSVISSTASTALRALRLARDVWRGTGDVELLKWSIVGCVALVALSAQCTSLTFRLVSATMAKDISGSFQLFEDRVHGIRRTTFNPAIDDTSFNFALALSTSGVKCRNREIGNGRIILLPGDRALLIPAVTEIGFWHEETTWPLSLAHPIACEPQ